MVKILFTGDNHLDIERPYSINRQRKESFRNAFKQIIDFAMANKVDLICHLGDLFDNYRPSPTQVRFVINQLIKLGEKNILFYLIRGNHEGAADIDDLFRGWAGDYVKIPNLPNVELIDPRFDEARKSNTIGYRNYSDIIRVYGIGYYRHETLDVIKKNLSPESIQTSKFNILLLHCYVESINDGNRITISESSVPIDEIIGLNFNVVALGHNHHQVKPEQKLNTTFFSPGSPIDWRFNHLGSHGFYVMNFDEASHKFDLEWHEVDNEYLMRVISVDGKGTPRPNTWFESELKKELQKLMEKTDKKLILEVSIKGTYEENSPRFQTDYVRKFIQSVVGTQLLYLGAISLKGLQYKIKKEMDIEKIRKEKVDEDTILEILKSSMDAELATIVLAMFKEVEVAYNDPKKLTGKKGEFKTGTRDELQSMIKNKVRSYYKEHLKEEELQKVKVIPEFRDTKKDEDDAFKKETKKKDRKKKVEQKDLSSLLRRSIEEAKK